MSMLIFAIWGCVQEFTKDCLDMTNASSTYLGIVIGALIGGVISWWIYNRQNKISREQDHILQHNNKLEQDNKKILMHLEEYTKHHDELLNRIVLLNENILAVDKKMQSMIEKQK